MSLVIVLVFMNSILIILMITEKSNDIDPRANLFSVMGMHDS
jgi:hypothetical protein